MSAARDLVVDARCTRGALALEANFTAGPGVTVLFGPTASGKTLTLRLVAGVERVERGAIRFGDATFDGDVHGARAFIPPRDRSLGFAPQDGALWPHRTALEHLTPFTDASRAKELLERVGLASHAARKPERLSGGERQRLAFARALSRERAILLLDEPFSALDDAARAAMGAIVTERAKSGVVLFVTHDRAEATRLGEQFVLFDRGKTITRRRLEE